MIKRSKPRAKTNAAPSTVPSRALAAEWRRKLAASGFDDIEHPCGDLRSPPAPMQNRAVGSLPQETYQDNADYYYAAGKFLHSNPFANQQDRRIWELHAEGVPYREIAASTGTYVRLVNDTINRLRNLMLASGGANHGGGGGGDGGSAWKRKVSRQLRRMDWETLLRIAPTLIKRSK